MIAGVTPSNSNRRRGRFGTATFRSLVTQVFLLATLFGGPGLARLAPEVETHAETSIALMQSICERAHASRLQTRSLAVSVDHDDSLERTARSARLQSTRGLPPGWLRNDLPAPLLC